MNNKTSQSNIRNLAFIGMFAALIFVSNKILSFEIQIPLSATPTRIHLGNATVLLAGFILGPISGGIASGIGSALFDFTDPRYFSSIPFTFVFKFLLAYVCGKISYSKNKQALSLGTNIVAAIAGSLTYYVLYLSRNFLTDLLFNKTEVATAIITTSQKAVISLINMILACIIAVPLSIIISKLLKKSNIIV